MATGSWEDCKKYGFMRAGGNADYQGFVRSLKVGYKVFAYLSGHGYVGLAEVIAEAVPEKDFVPPGQSRRLVDWPRTAAVSEDVKDPEKTELTS